MSGNRQQPVKVRCKQCSKLVATYRRNGDRLEVLGHFKWDRHPRTHKVVKPSQEQVLKCPQRHDVSFSLKEAS